MATTDRVTDLRVAVLMGGPSSEREVSLETGAGVLAALVERGYNAVGIDWTEGLDLGAALSGAGVVWNALHGTYGEDGAVQGLLDCLKIPYTGDGVLACALAMDKIVAKELFVHHGVPTPAGGIAATIDEARAIGIPCVIKPAEEGSSVGVTIVRDEAALDGAFERAASCHGPVMVEPYIAGYEIQTGILGGEVLGSVEVRPAVEFYDYQAKYQRDDTQYLVPPCIDPAWTERAEAAALAAFRALRCRAYGRVDLRVSETGEPFVLEVNTLPGMTSHSLLPKIAARAGIDYAGLCERILALALS